MPCTVEYLEADRIVAASFAGIVGVQELDNAIDEIMRLTSVHGTARFLVDVSALAGGHTIINLNARLDGITRYEFAEPVREALVVAPGASVVAVANTDYWAGALRQRGFNVQTFVARDSALKWLRDA
jgi:hypothetical protein